MFPLGRGTNRFAYTLEVTFDSQAELKRAIDMTMLGESVRLYHPEFSESVENPIAPRATVTGRGPGISFTESIRQEIKVKLSPPPTIIKPEN